MRNIGMVEKKPQVEKKNNVHSTNLLKEITQDLWEYMLEENVYIRILEGLKVTKLPPVSYEDVNNEVKYMQTLLDRLHKIKFSELEYNDQLTYKIVEWEIEQKTKAFKFFWLQFPICPYSSPLRIACRAYNTYNFIQESDLKDYLELLKKLPRFITDIRTRLVKQQKRKILLPKDEIDLIVNEFLPNLIQKPTESLFFVTSSRLEKLAPDQIHEFHHNISQVIISEVNPAFENLIKLLSDEYRKAAPDAVGLYQYPDGNEYYRFLVNHNTSVPISPEEVHKIGLREVERLNAQIQQIQDRLGFQGTMHEFLEATKNDRRFYAKTPEEIGERLKRFVRAIEPKINSYFNRTPKAPYKVQCLDPRLEASMSFGYYEEPTVSEPAGIYYYNGANLDQQFLINLAQLIYHELIPGHHFQSALQLEAKHDAEILKRMYTTANVEGWAEYAADLAKEMGMYNNPYDLYGRLLDDKFMAVRLVVDTGMNYYGWSREKAVNYMKENQVLVTKAQIISESLRYSVDIPGQALAYKMGNIKFWELRKKTEKALGDNFDIRKFHDAVIGYSALPLSDLEWHIDNFIEKELKSAN